MFEDVYEQIEYYFRLKALRLAHKVEFFSQDSFLSLARVIAYLFQDIYKSYQPHGDNHPIIVLQHLLVQDQFLATFFVMF